MTYPRIALVLSLFGLLACAKAVEPLPDKNTNWLKACDEDAECGSELACLCGACTKACESDAQCGRTAPGATCLAAGDPSIQALCGTQLKAAAVCSAECKHDSDCDPQADGLRCAAGVCVPWGGRTPEATTSCEPGDVVANICGMECPGLNETAFATCGEDGHYGPCSCRDPHCGPALDCAAGFVCLGNRCLEAASRCAGALCQAGAECTDGLCMQVLVDGLSSPGGMGISSVDGALYFVNTGTYDEQHQFNFDAMLARVPVSGGPYERLREDLNEMWDAVFMDNAAYWYNVRDGVAFQVTGKFYFSDEPTSIFLTDHAITTLIADDDAFYWIEQNDQDGPGPMHLMTATRATLQPEARRLLELPEATYILTQTDERLYWGTALSGLWSVKKDGSDLKRMVEPRAELRGPDILATAGGHVMWSWGDRTNGKIGLGLYSEAPGTSTRLTEDMSGGLGEYITGDESNVYWIYRARGDDQYTLARASKAPFATEVLWRSPQLRETTHILVHEGFLYLSTMPVAGEGKILRIQLPR
ncbi:MAG TPA: hypothetical protein VJV78_46115 [Polyangiales bacterium]|nr:hypothetical protein [Polyangiales bacterium]